MVRDYTLKNIFGQKLAVFVFYVSISYQSSYQRATYKIRQQGPYNFTCTNVKVTSQTHNI